MKTTSAPVFGLRIPVEISAGAERSTPFSCYVTLLVGPFLNESSALVWRKNFLAQAATHETLAKAGSVKRIESRIIRDHKGDIVTQVRAPEIRPALKQRPSLVVIVINDPTIVQADPGRGWDIDPGGISPRQLSDELVENVLAAIKRNSDYIV